MNQRRLVSRFLLVFSVLMFSSMLQACKSQAGSSGDNEPVPVIPWYFPANEEAGSALPYSSGYLYIIKEGNVWREILIQGNSQFAEIDINKYLNEEAGYKPLRQAELNITSPAGSPYSYEPFQVKENGTVVKEGTLDSMGQERVFNLSEEEVDVVMTSYNPPDVFTVKTQLSPYQKREERKGDGEIMPYILLPNNIYGESQIIYVVYSNEPLTLTQLDDVEKNPENYGVKLTGKIEGRNKYGFISSGEGTQFLTLPEAKKLTQQQVGGDNHSLSEVPNSFNMLTFLYPGYASLDPPDVYYELRQTGGSWSQRVYLGEAAISEEGQYLLSFIGWSDEMEYIDLIRHNEVEFRYPSTIFSNVSVADLLDEESE